jgi:hypothetical protein
MATFAHNQSMTDAGGTQESLFGDWVARLKHAAETGVALDLAPGETVNPAETEAWPPERTIPAAAVRAVVTDPDLRVDPHGLQIRAALFSECLDIEYVKFPHPLSFAFCAFKVGVKADLVQLFHLELDHVVVDGGVRLQGAHIDGQLNLKGAVLNSPKGTALALTSAHIARGVSATDGFRAQGQVRAVGARIDGQFNLKGAVLNNPNGIALNLDGAYVTGGLFAIDGFRADGQIRAIAARIDEQLNLKGAVLCNPDGIALNLDGAQISGSLLGTNGFHVQGEVRAISGRIDGQVNLAGAVIENPNGLALRLDQAHISENFFGSDGFRVTGEIRGVGVRVDGQLSLDDADVQNPSGTALDLERAKIGSLHLRPSMFLGAVDLVRTTITVLVTLDDPPAPLDATGWSIGDLHGPLGHDWRKARSWLETNRAIRASGQRFRPFNKRAAGASTGSNEAERVSVQPWHALAEVFDRNGDPAGARHLRLAAARRVTRQSPWPTRTLRRMYYLVAGNGYYPLFAIVWMFAILFATVWLVTLNREDIVPTDQTGARVAVQQHFGITPSMIGPELAAKQHQADAFLPVTAETPCEVHPDYPCMDSLTLSINTVVPPAASTNGAWTIASDATLALTALLPLLKLLSWALAALLLAGVTGLLRKN